MMEGLNMSFRH